MYLNITTLSLNEPLLKYLHTTGISDYGPVSESLRFDASSSTRCSNVSILTSYAHLEMEPLEAFHISIVGVPPATVVILESRKLLTFDLVLQARSGT